MRFPKRLDFSEEFSSANDFRASILHAVSPSNVLMEPACDLTTRLRVLIWQRTVHSHQHTSTSSAVLGPFVEPAARRPVKQVARVSGVKSSPRTLLTQAELEHMTGYLQARQSEPCTRNALREPHTAMAFMEEVAVVEPSDKFTTSRVYAVIQEELLANTIPESPATQAPRMMVCELAKLEEDIVDVASPIYWSDSCPVDPRTVLGDSAI